MLAEYEREHLTQVGETIAYRVNNNFNSISINPPRL